MLPTNTKERDLPVHDTKRLIAADSSIDTFELIDLMGNRITEALLVQLVLRPCRRGQQAT